MPTTDTMNDIIKLGEKSLKISDLGALVEECVDGFDLRKAKAFAKQLELAVPEAPFILKPQVHGMIARLKILALPLYYDRDDILNPFRVGLGPALHYETPYVTQRLQAKFLDFDIAARDQWRQDIVTTLHQNSDVITSHGPAGTPNAAGTVVAWLTDYDRAVGSGIAEDVKVAGYLFRSRSTSALSPDERQAVVRLIQLYEYLKLSSATSLGVEESLDFEKDGVIYDLNRGRPVPILDLRPATTVLAKSSALAAVAAVRGASSSVLQPTSPSLTPPKVPPAPQSRQPLSVSPSVARAATPVSPPAATPPQPPQTPSLLASNEVTTELLKLRGLNAEKVRASLWQGIQQRARAAVLAGLRALAESGELMRIVSVDGQFSTLLATYYRSQQRQNELNDLSLSPSNPRYVRELARVILQDQCRFSENDAAHIGIELNNLLRMKNPQLVHWAYYDMKTASYKWM